MLKVNNLSKRFGVRTVLAGVSFTANAGELTGIVGANGSGKTTLLNIIAGIEAPDGGNVRIASGARVGYLRQGYAGREDCPVADMFPAAFARPSGEARVTAIAERMTQDDSPELAEEYAEAVATLESTGSSLEELFRQLDIRPIEPNEPVGRLSGGEQSKLGLVEIAASRPDVLLLDEPTNNLDLDALTWLDGFLAAFRGPALVVSHDRTLLDEHATSILEIDPVTRGLEVYADGYTAYAEEKARREQETWARYRRQQEHQRRVRQEIRQIKQVGRSREHLSQNDYYRRRNKKFVRRAVVLERRLERDLASSDQLEKPIRRPYRVKAELAPAKRGGDRMLAVEGLDLELGGRTLVRNARCAIGWGERVVLVGPNGAGKTTLLRALADETASVADRVHHSPSARIGMLPQVEAEPLPGITPLDVVRAASSLSETEARRFLHRFLFSGDEALTPVARLSYGERRRLSLASLVLGGVNLLLLDEPTNHLDIPSHEAFEAALDAYEGAMLAVTHDRYFIERFARRVLELRGGELREVWAASSLG